MKVDVKHFFNVAEVVNLADPAIVAPAETAEVEFDDLLVQWMECYHTSLRNSLDHGTTLAARWSSCSKTWVFFIEREIHNLTKDEEKKFHR